MRPIFSSHEVIFANGERERETKAMDPFDLILHKYTLTLMSNPLSPLSIQCSCALPFYVTNPTLHWSWVCWSKKALQDLFLNGGKRAWWVELASETKMAEIYSVISFCRSLEIGPALSPEICSFPSRFDFCAIDIPIWLRVVNKGVTIANYFADIGGPWCLSNCGRNQEVNPR